MVQIETAKKSLHLLQLNDRRGIALYKECHPKNAPQSIPIVQLQYVTWYYIRRAITA